MAKKEKLTNGALDLDDDLDLDFLDIGDEIDGLANPEIGNKKRNVVYNAFEGVIKGAKSKLTDKSFQEQVFRNALPKEYGDVIDRYGDVKDSVASLYNDAVKDVKPSISKAVKHIDKIIPEENKRTKKVLEKFKSSLGIYDERPNKEVTKEESLANELKSIFDIQAETTIELRNHDKAEEALKTKIETDRYNNQHQMMNAISLGVTRLANYNDKINAAYQKKSLELQFRSYFTQAELLKEVKKYNEIYNKQNEAIIKNTALPEYVKLQNSERFTELARTKFYDSVHEGLFGKGDFIKQGFGKLRGKVLQATGDFKGKVEDALFAAESVRDANESMREMGMELTPEGTGGEIVGGGVTDKAANWLTGKIRNVLSKDGTRTGKLGHKWNRYANNLPGLINDLMRSEKLQDKYENFGFLENLMNSAKGLTREGLASFLESGKDMKLDTGKGIFDLNQPGIGFDNASKKSIVTIIPGYLARILREIQVFRTGNDKVELTLFDHNQDKFLSRSSSSLATKKYLNEKLNGNNFTKRLDYVSEYLTKDTNVTPEAEKALKEKLALLSYESKSYDKKTLTNEDFYKGLDPAIAAELKSLIEDKFSGDDVEAKENELSSRVVGLRGSIRDVRGDIQALLNAGHTDQLIELGIVEKKGNQYSINYDKYKKLGLENVDFEDTTDSTGPGIISDSRPGLRRRSRRDRTPIQSAIDLTEVTDLLRQNLQNNTGPNLPPPIDCTCIKDYLVAPVNTLVDLNTKILEQITNVNENIKNIQSGNDSAVNSKIAQLLDNLLNRQTSPINDTNPGDQGLSASGTIIGSITGGIGTVITKLGKAVKGTGDALVGGTKLAYKPIDFLIKALNKSIKVDEDVELTDSVDDKKNPLAELTKKLFTIGGGILGTTFTSVSKAVGNIFSKQLPAGFKGLSLIASKAKNSIKGFLDKPIDIYVPGIRTPKLSAIIMRNGGYFDQVTGKPILNPSDIVGPVINTAGEVVLTIEDISKGLFDSRGQQIKGVAEKAISFVKDFGAKGYERLTRNLTSAKNLVTGLFRSKDSDAESTTVFKDKNKTANTIKDTLIDIRDILLARLPYSGLNIHSNEYADPTQRYSGDSVRLPGLPDLDAPEFNDSDADGDRDNNWQEMLDTNERKKRKRRRKPKVNRKTRYRGRGNIIDTVASAAGNLAGSFTEDSYSGYSDVVNKAPTDNAKSNSVLDVLTSIKDTLGEQKENLKDNIIKFPGKVKDTVFDTDGNGLRQGHWKERLDELARKKAEREKNREENLASNDPRYKSNQNIIDTMIEKAKALMGFGADGLGGLAGDLLDSDNDRRRGRRRNRGRGGRGRPGLLRRTGARIGGAIRGLPGGNALMSGVGKVGSALGTAGRFLIGAPGTAVRAGTLLAGAGSTLAGIATSPITLGALAIGTTAYGGYKLYKHLNRNKLEPVDKVRITQYGFGPAESKELEPLFNLEEYLQSECISFRGSVPIIDDNKLDGNTILDIFGAKDPEHQARLTQWFTHRFKPVFLTSLGALKLVANKDKLHQLSEIDKPLQLKYLTIVKDAAANYNVLASPLSNKETLSADKALVDKTIADSIAEISKEDKSLWDSTKEIGAGIVGSVLAGADKVKETAIVAKTKANQILEDTGVKDKLKQFDEATKPARDAIAEATKPVTDVVGGIADSVTNKAKIVGAGVAFASDAAGTAITVAFNYFRSKLLMLRMAQYGFSPRDSSEYSKIEDLEQHFIKKNIVRFRGDEPFIDTNREIGVTMWTIFGAIKSRFFGDDVRDEIHGARISVWYRNRFLPVFLSHIAALRKIAPKEKLKDVEDLSDTQKAKYIKATEVPDSVYAIPISPLEDGKPLTATKETYEALKAELLKELGNADLFSLDKEKERKATEAIKLEEKATQDLTKTGAVGKIETMTKDNMDKLAQELADKSKQNQEAAKAIGAIAVPDSKASADLANVLNQPSPNELATNKLKANIAVELAEKTRDKVTALEAVRMKMYGLTETEKDKITILRVLEEYLMDKININAAGIAIFNGSIHDLITQVGGNFNLASVGDEYAAEWLKWFKNRFLPVYLTYMGHGYLLTNKQKPYEIELALKDGAKYDLAIKLLALPAIWNITNSPWKDYKVNTEITTTDENLKFLKERANKEKLYEETAGKINAAKANLPQMSEYDNKKKTAGEQILANVNKPGLVGESNSVEPGVYTKPSMLERFTDKSNPGSAQDMSLASNVVTNAGIAIVESKDFKVLAPIILKKLMSDLGLTAIQAAGIVGNLAHESGGFKYHQEIKPLGGGRGGIGWAQWTGVRRRQFEKWASQNKMDLRSNAASYGYLIHELTNTSEKKAVTAVKKTSTIENAVKVFEQNFERAGVKHYASRIKYAKQALALAANSGADLSAPATEPAIESSPAMPIAKPSLADRLFNNSSYSPGEISSNSSPDLSGTTFANIASNQSSVNDNTNIDNTTEAENPSIGDAKASNNDNSKGTTTAISGKIPTAVGKLADPSQGDQFITAKRDTTLNNMHPTVLKYFKAMAAEYGQKTGKKILVNEGFRTRAQQAALRRKYGSRAAPPGTSLHEFGLALDVNTVIVDELEKLGLMRKYGFTRPVKNETWHMEPAGIQLDHRRARTDKAWADERIAASLGRGGGGWGTMKAGKKDPGRNVALAKKLLGPEHSSFVEVKDETVEGSEGPTTPALDTDTQTSTESGGVAATTGTTGTEANSDVSVNSSPVDTGMNASESILSKVSNNISGESSPLGNIGSEEVKSEADNKTTTGVTDIAGTAQPGNVGANTSEPTTFSGKNTDIKNIIAKGAKMTGMDPNVMLAFAAIESDLNPKAKAPTSSATGLFQFLDGTWKEVLRKYGKKYNLSANASRYDPLASTLMGAEYAKANAKYAGKSNPNATDLYLTHFLGPGGAKQFLSMSDSAIPAQTMPKQAKANKSIFYAKGGGARTKAQIYAELTRRIAMKAKQHGITVPNTAGAMTEGTGGDASGGYTGSGATGGGASGDSSYSSTGSVSSGTNSPGTSSSTRAISDSSKKSNPLDDLADQFLPKELSSLVKGFTGDLPSDLTDAISGFTSGKSGDLIKGVGNLAGKGIKTLGGLFKPGDTKDSSNTNSTDTAVSTSTSKAGPGLFGKLFPGSNAVRTDDPGAADRLAHIRSVQSGLDSGGTVANSESEAILKALESEPDTASTSKAGPGLFGKLFPGSNAVRTDDPGAADRLAHIRSVQSGLDSDSTTSTSSTGSIFDGIKSFGDSAGSGLSKLASGFTSSFRPTNLTSTTAQSSAKSITSDPIIFGKTPVGETSAPSTVPPIPSLPALDSTAQNPIDSGVPMGTVGLEGTLSNVDQTLTKSLDIQTQSLNVLKEILTAINNKPVESKSSEAPVKANEPAVTPTPTVKGSTSEGSSYSKPGAISMARRLMA